MEYHVFGTWTGLRRIRTHCKIGHVELPTNRCPYSGETDTQAIRTSGPGRAELSHTLARSMSTPVPDSLHNLICRSGLIWTALISPRITQPDNRHSHLLGPFMKRNKKKYLLFAFSATSLSELRERFGFCRAEADGDCREEGDGDQGLHGSSFRRFLCR